MDDEQKIRRLIEQEYASLGGDAQPISGIIPRDGGWGNALSYEVVRADGKRARVMRRHIDVGDHRGIRDALRRFRESR